MLTFEWDIPNDRVRRTFSSHQALPATSDDRFADVLRVVHPDDRPAFQDAVQSALKSATGKYQAEFRVVDENGKVSWIYEEGQVEFDSQHRPLRLVGVAQDVTTRNLARAHLQQSESRYRSLFESIDDGFCIVEMLFDDQGNPRDYRFLEANPAFYSATGAQGVIGKTALELWPSLDRWWVQTYGEVALTGEPRRFENHSVTLGRWFDVYAFRFGSAEQRQVAILFRNISDRKLAEEARRRSEERFRVLVEAGSQATWEASPQGEATTDSPSWRAFTGQTIQQWMGDGWNSVVHPDDRQRALAHWKATVARGSVYHDEFRIRRADGVWRWTSVVAAPVRDDDGRITKWVGMNTDITDRKEAEARVRQSEWFHRQTLESIPGMTFTNTPDGSCDYVSEQWLQYTGLPLAEQLGHGWTRSLHPDDREATLAAWHRATSSGGGYDLEYRVRRHDGVYEWFKVRGRAIREPDGQIARWFGVLVNIDNLKRAEEALRQSEQRLRLALEAGQLGFWDWNIATGEVQFGGHWASMLGYELHEIEPNVRAWEWLLHPDEKQRVMQVLTAHLEGRTPFYECEHRLRHKDGSWRWILDRGQVVQRDEQGKPLRAVGTHVDVTARREAEAALRRSRDELERRVQERTAELRARADQLARLTSQLTLTEHRQRRQLAQVLHDHLQQLLVGAKFKLGVVSRRLPPEQAEDILQASQLLTEAIEASRSLTVELSPPILHEAGLAAGLQWLARWMGQKHGLHVRLATDENVRVDREAVRLLVFQAVRELLFNVAKHAGVDRADVEVQVKGDQLQVRVEDQGVGFDPEATVTQDLYSGFGLFSIRERLEFLGGRFEMHSAPGHGSRFRLTVPLSQPDAPPSLEPHRPRGAGVGDLPTQAATARRASLRVLLVDDHAVMRQGLRLLLNEEPDLEIVGEAGDGVEALDLARRLTPDVVLMDFSMPRMDGVEATRILHSELPHIRVIGLSMYAEADRAGAMLNAGACAYLQKTGETHELLSAIRGRSDRVEPARA